MSLSTANANEISASLSFIHINQDVHQHVYTCTYITRYYSDLILCDNSYTASIILTVTKAIDC